MNKFIFLAVFVFGLFFCLDSSLAAVIFFDGFETGFSEWTGNDLKWTTSGTTVANGVHGGSKRAQTKGNSATAPRDEVLIKSISTEGYGNINLSFWYRVYDSLEDADHVYVEWTEDGSNWNLLKDFTSVTESVVWELVSYNLPADAAGKANFAVRFRANLETGGDVFYLDDVNLAGDGGLNNAPTPTSLASPEPSAEASEPTSSETPVATPTPTPSSAVSQPSQGLDGQAGSPASSPSATPTPSSTPKPTTTKTPAPNPSHASAPLPSVSSLPSLSPSNTPVPTAVSSSKKLNPPNLLTRKNSNNPISSKSDDFSNSEETSDNSNNLSASLFSAVGSQAFWLIGMMIAVVVFSLSKLKKP